MDASERDALVAALARLGESSPVARTLAVVHRGLGTRSAAVDVERWTKTLDSAAQGGSALGGASYAPAPDRAELESRIDQKASLARAQPSDAAAHLELAEAKLAHARDPATRQSLAADPKAGRKFERLLFEDAYRSAVEAEKLGATGWRVNSAIALAAQEQGNVTEAEARAEAAVKDMPPDVQGWHSMAVLQLFAHARQKAITKAIVDKTQWPQQWMTDVHAAYAVLARHPLGTDQHIVDHYDFLKWLGARGQAARVLDHGLARFAESWQIHDRLRGRLLAEKGVDGIEPAYDALLQGANPPPDMLWFSGYASLVVAEFHRRGGRAEPALASYERAIAQFEQFVKQSPERRDSADHYVAVAHGGRARVAFEAKDDERAVREVLLSFARRAASAATLDGLNISTVDTAKVLLTRLRENKRDDLVAQLDGALNKLDPELLQLPAYERETPPQGGGGQRRGRRRG
jgi:hypothetical protein